MEGSTATCLRRDERRGAGALGVEHLVLLSGDRQFLQFDRLRFELEILPTRLSEAEKDVLGGLWLEPDHARGDGVRTADTKVGEAVRAACPHHGAILGAAGHVYRHHHGVLER